MLNPPSVETADHLPDSQSLQLCRRDGGWVILSGTDHYPIALRSPREVLDCVRLFLGDKHEMPVWGLRARGPEIGANCAISKVYGGYLIGFVATDGASQVVAFSARDVMRSVAAWTGLTDSVSPLPITPSIDGGTQP